ncbi:plasmid replication protein, CyRepA1 family [Massilia sp. PWRC2]|uniref:plasmid replication protein, CyRepA1 family n=1 Tax=Massilia sp. PWRC2 TaxID=2804626 RepID=UPI003CF4439E
MIIKEGLAAYATEREPGGGESRVGGGLSASPIKVFHLNGKRLAVEVRVAGIDLRNAGTVFIKSPKGTGKTRFLAEYLNTLPKSSGILALVHRRSLAKSLSNELGLSCYLDEPELQKKYVISVDSLIRYNPKIDILPDVLVLDESEQMFRHLISETTKADRGLIFNILVWLINNAKQIICSDADLTGDLTVHLISKLRSSFEQEQSISIVNEWQTTQSIEVYEDKKHLVADLALAVAEGKRVYVPVGELALANTLTSLLQFVCDPDGKPIKVLTLTGMTSDSLQAKAFFGNPNEEAMKYHVIIANSVLSTGVSIDVKWFDMVIGIFDRSVYTFQDCDQAISRVRSCPSIKVWLHSGPKALFNSEMAIRSGPTRREMITRSFTGLDRNGRLSDMEELYIDVESRIRWCEQKWKENRVNQFVELKVDDGWAIIEVHKNDNLSGAGGEMLLIGKDPSGDAYFNSILDADNLSFEEYSELNSAKNVRGDDRKALTKYWISQFFDLKSPANVTIDQIKSFKEKGFDKVVRNARLLKDSRIDAIGRDKWERENVKSKKAITDYGHRTAKRDILEAAQEKTGISYAEVWAKAKLHGASELRFNDAKLLCRSKSNKYREASKKRKQDGARLKWVVTQAQIDDLAKYANDNLCNINLFFATNFKTPTAPEAKMKVFNTIMGELGIEIKKKPKQKGGDGHEYVIDYDRVAELVATKNLSDIAGM